MSLLLSGSILINYVERSNESLKFPLWVLERPPEQPCVTGSTPRLATKRGARPARCAWWVRANCSEMSETGESGQPQFKAGIPLSGTDIAGGEKPEPFERGAEDQGALRKSDVCDHCILNLVRHFELMFRLARRAWQMWGRQSATLQPTQLYTLDLDVQSAQSVDPGQSSRFRVGIHNLTDAGNALYICSEPNYQLYI
jgi:hypothetical protein